MGRNGSWRLIKKRLFNLEIACFLKKGTGYFLFNKEISSKLMLIKQSLFLKD